MSRRRCRVSYLPVDVVVFITTVVVPTATSATPWISWEYNRTLRKSKKCWIVGQEWWRCWNGELNLLSQFGIIYLSCTSSSGCGIIISCHPPPPCNSLWGIFINGLLVCRGDICCVLCIFHLSFHNWLLLLFLPSLLTNHFSTLSFRDLWVHQPAVMWWRWERFFAFHFGQFHLLPFTASHISTPILYVPFRHALTAPNQGGQGW